MTLSEPLPGQRLARGVCRMLSSFDFSGLEEFVPDRGLRVDVIAVGPSGEIWIVECKSSRADFMSDHKWEGYLPWCDRFFWAVGPEFPIDILPADTGLILHDGFDGEILRYGPETRLAGGRRSGLMRRIARTASERLSRLRDAEAAVGV